MASAKSYIAACSCVAMVASAAWLVAAECAESTCRQVQSALESLQAGRYEQAEASALDLAANSARPHPRAWALVAAARQQQGRHVSAARAYRMFLGSCSSPPLRRYVMEQIGACHAAAEPAPAPVAPSRRLSEADLLELAKVDDRTYAESTEHFVVRARNAGLAKLTAGEAEVALRRICQVVLAGQAYPHAVEINVWADRAEYLTHAQDAPEWSGGSFSLAFRDGQVRRRIDLTQRDEGGKFATIMLDRVLPHEMCHLVAREYFGDSACPLLVNEGLATMAEAEADNGRLLLAGSALASKARTLDSLLLSQRSGLEDPPVFYAMSFSFMSYLRARLAEQQFRDFLEHLKDGCTVVDAIQRAILAPQQDDFADALASAWEDHAIAQAQYIRALRGQEQLSLLRAR